MLFAWEMKHILDVVGVNAIDMGATIYNYKNLKNEFPREVLIKLLLDDKYTYRELQELYIYNERLWSKLAKEYNIPKQNNVIRKNCNNYHSVDIDNELLIKLYVEDELSMNEIGRIFGCSRVSIKNRLIKNGIEIRPNNYNSYYKNRNYKTASEYYIASNGYMQKSSDREHRKVMENYIGRKLNSNEHVHHVDFDKTNNDINNLFLFNDVHEHNSYHGYIKNHNYISPDKFMNEVYPKILYYKSKDFLYEQYITLNKSIAQISRETSGLLSRSVITRLLKSYKLFDNDNKHINQFK